MKLLINKIIIILLSFSLSFPAYSKCEKPVITLEEGQAAPCKGYLFSPEKEQEVRLMQMEFSLIEKENTLLNNKIITFDKEMNSVNTIIEKEREYGELWRTTAVNTTKEYVSVQESRGTRDIIWFAAGIATAVIASIIVKNAAR